MRFNKQDWKFGAVAFVICLVVYAIAYSDSYNQSMNSCQKVFSDAECKRILGR